MTEDVAEIVEKEVVEVEPDEPEQPEPQPEPAREWTDEEAQEAKDLGWKSPDEWVGDVPAGYIDDPRRYLERAENSAPFRNLREKMDRELKAQRETTERLERMNEKALERQRKQYETSLEQIRKEKRAAAELGDVDRYDALDKQEQGMEPPPEADEVKAKTEPDPFMKEYAEQNEWVKNPILFRAAAELIDARPDVLQRPPQEQVAFAEAEIRKMYPAYFPATEAPKPPAPAKVDGGGLAGTKKKEGFDTLPSDAKAQFKRFVADGLFTDDEKGRKEYFDDY